DTTAMVSPGRPGCQPPPRSIEGSERLTMAKPTENRVLEAVYRAIDEVNLQLPADRRLKKSSETALFGRAGSLDSLGLVNLIVAVEQAVEDELGASVTLADEKAMSQNASPFRTVGSLAAYVQRQLAEQGAGV